MKEIENAGEKQYLTTQKAKGNRHQATPLFRYERYALSLLHIDSCSLTLDEFHKLEYLHLSILRSTLHIYKKFISFLKRVLSLVFVMIPQIVENLVDVHCWIVISAHKVTTFSLLGCRKDAYCFISSFSPTFHSPLPCRSHTPSKHKLPNLCMFISLPEIIIDFLIFCP